MVLATPKQAADTAGVSLETLRRWVREGKLSEHRTPGGHRRYDLEELERLVARERPDTLEELPEAGHTDGELVSIVPGVIPLAARGPVDGERLYGLDNAALDQHLFYCGRTGSGKSELMKWQVLGVVKSGYPLVVVDPHGAVADDLLSIIVRHAPERLADVVYVDFGDSDWPPQFNPLDVRDRAEIEPAVRAVAGMLERGLFDAPRALNYAQLALATLCEANLRIEDPAAKLSLLHLTSFLLDAELRSSVIALSENLAAKEMFDSDTGLFEQLADKERALHVQPLLRVLQPFANSQAYSALFASSENRLRFTDLIAADKIVLLKLARQSHQAQLGEYAASLVLDYLLATVDEWGRRRDPVSGESSGRGCRVFVDEAPSVLGPRSQATTILADARRYDLGLVFTCQFPDQFDETVLQALLANTANKLSLTLDPASAELIAPALDGGSGAVRPSDIALLPNYHFYGKILTADGPHRHSTSPFHGQAPHALEHDLDDEGRRLREQAIDRSRLLLCARGDEVRAGLATRLVEIKAALGVVHDARLRADEPGYGIHLSARPSVVTPRVVAGSSVRLKHTPGFEAALPLTPEAGGERQGPPGAPLVASAEEDGGRWLLRLVFAVAEAPASVARRSGGLRSGSYPFLDFECRAASLAEAMSQAEETLAEIEGLPDLLRVETLERPSDRPWA